MMNRISVLVLLLSMVIVGSDNNSNNNNNNNNINNNNNNHNSSSFNSTIVSSSITSDTADIPRDKRGTSLQLDQSEIARQNQITQQIFANYLERRLFPNRSGNQKIPTIAEILPKATTSTTARPRPRGFSSTAALQNLKRDSVSTKSKATTARNRLRNAQNKNQHFRDIIKQHVFEPPAVDPHQKFHDRYPEDDDDDVEFDGQESLQSVESEQHDQYYGDVFNRDPSENEIDSDPEFLRNLDVIERHLVQR